MVSEIPEDLPRIPASPVLRRGRYDPGQEDEDYEQSKLATRKSWHYYVVFPGCEVLHTWNDGNTVGDHLDLPGLKFVTQGSALRAQVTDSV